MLYNDIEQLEGEYSGMYEVGNDYSKRFVEHA